MSELSQNLQINDPIEITLVRFPASWNQLAEKESHQINNLEQILVAKVFNFCGICSSLRPLGAGREARESGMR